MATATVAPTPSVRKDNLAVLYQGLLTVIVRLQSGRQPFQDVRAFRKRIQDVLSEVDREAVKLGYRVEDVADASYAVVAFLDEAIFTCNDPARSQWSSLQAEMYQREVAGEGVFDRLDVLRKRGDSRRLADIFEVYYLCFLLGYKGKYAVGSDLELRRIQDELKERIERVRGPNVRISPEELTEAPPAFVPVAAPVSRSFGWLAAGSAGLLILCWCVFRFLLSSQASSVLP